MEEDSPVTSFPVILEKDPFDEEPPLGQAETRPGVLLLRSWLNTSLTVEMTDGRILIGVFLCTDRDANIILGSCSEYLPFENNSKITNEEPRMLGLVMVPGKHIVSIILDPNVDSASRNPFNKHYGSEEIM
ncbi:unnamed protein product [Diabrotica balteata]|uniref:Sm domain-containing protein n=1 Tax=Diabrotica balteata TaxID=107213 RepID=A0A9N9T6Y6_DIABA|nr:unnamed protein product [Diabrotica balteata]